MRMRIENTFLRAMIGLSAFVALLALFLFFMSPVMVGSANPDAKAMYLFFAGPTGAMVTHMHLPLFALLVLLLTPFVIAASVSRRRRKLSVVLGTVLWFLFGALFAMIPLAG